MKRRLDIQVIGIPRPQGSKNVHHGENHSWVSEANPNLRPWRDSVCWYARQQLQAVGQSPFAGPVRLEVTFTFSRLKSHYGARGLKPSAPRYKATAPDLSKLVRGVEDALTEAGIWRNDAPVVSLNAVKVFGEQPGALITITEVDK